MCVRAHTDTLAVWAEWREEESRVLRRNVWRPEGKEVKKEGTFCSCRSIFPLYSHHSGFLLENKKIKLKEERFSSQTVGAVWRGSACTDATPGCTCRVSTVSELNFFGPSRGSWIFSLFLLILGLPVLMCHTYDSWLTQNKVLYSFGVIIWFGLKPSEGWRDCS